MSHTHHFNPLSGYCDRCGYRDDGRLVSRDGEVWREGPNYTPQQLSEFLAKGQNR